MTLVRKYVCKICKISDSLQVQAATIEDFSIESVVLFLWLNCTCIFYNDNASFDLMEF